MDTCRLFNIFILDSDNGRASSSEYPDYDYGEDYVNDDPGCWWDYGFDRLVCQNNITDSAIKSKGTELSLVDGMQIHNTNDII